MQELGPNQMAWLRELESDKYEQAENKLAVVMLGEQEYRYCCLGVGCEIANIESEEDNSWSPGSIKEKIFDGESSLAPPSLQEWLALGDEYGSALHDVDVPLNIIERNMLLRDLPSFDIALTGFNDEGMTFRHIASIVRRCPEAFFTEPR